MNIFPNGIINVMRIVNFKFITQVVLISKEDLWGIFFYIQGPSPPKKKENQFKY